MTQRTRTLLILLVATSLGLLLMYVTFWLQSADVYAQARPFRVGVGWVADPLDSVLEPPRYAMIFYENVPTGCTRLLLLKVYSVERGTAFTLIDELAVVATGSGSYAIGNTPLDSAYDADPGDVYVAECQDNVGNVTGRAQTQALANPFYPRIALPLVNN